MNKGNNKRTKKLITAISVMLVMVCVIGGALAGVMYSNPFAENVNEEGLEKVEMVGGKAVVNVLIVGLDKSECNADVIMLVRFDERFNSVSAMSIPRDTYVKFGDTTALINTAVVRPVKTEDGTTKPGGVSLLAQKVTALTGVPINYYVVFKVGTFETLIDELGGIDFNVEDNLNYDDPAQGLSIHIRKGQQHLDGKTAEGLVRFRKYPQADLKRVKVQQDVLTAIIDQKLNVKYLGQIPGIYNELKDKIQSNIKISEIVDYGKRALDLDMNKVYTFTMPTKSAHDAHLYPDVEGINAAVANYFGDTEPDPNFKVKSAYGDF